MISSYDLLISISIWFQSLGDWLFPVMQGITFLGNEEFYLLIMPILYWCISQPLGLQVGIILLVSGGINFLLKLAFHTPRPYWVSNEILNVISDTSYGFPSGHAQNAVSVWGLMAAKVRKSWGKAALITLIILIGISRLILGVHFIHDVVGGWLIGAAILLLYLLFQEPISSWFSTRSFRSKLTLSFLISLLFIILSLLLTSPLMKYRIPAAWVENVGESFHPFNLDGIFTIAGVLFGLLSGVFLLNGRGGFSAQGPVWQRALRYPIGLAGVLILYLGLGWWFPDGASSLAFTLRYLRYLLIGLWISYGAPRLFIALNLARRKQA